MTKPTVRIAGNTGRPAAVALRAAFALTAAVAAGTAAHAQSTLSASVTIEPLCELSTTTAINFGSTNVISGLNVNSNGTFRIRCTSGTFYTAAFDAGTGTGATRTVRKMTNGVSFLNYTLYTSSAYTTIYGDGQDGTVLYTTNGTGSATFSNRPVFGRIFAGQSSVPAGHYTDTVTIIVTY